MHIHQLSRASWPAQRARPHTHVCAHTWRDGEADRPGKQTSHSPVVHLMFHDMTASDVSFPNTHSSKDISRTTKSQNKFCLPKWEDGQVEEAEQGQVKQMAVIEEVYLKKDRACKDGERGYSEDRGYAGCTLCDRLDLLLKGLWMHWVKIGSTLINPELHLDPVS